MMRQICLLSQLVIILLLLPFGDLILICIAKKTENVPNHIQSNRNNQPKSLAVTEGLKNAVASGLAAACCKIVLAPFDTLKTVQQQSREGTTLVKAFQTVLQRQGGVLNLYAGLDVAVIGSMPSVGLYFGVYSYCKRNLLPILEKNLGEEKAGLARTLAVATSAAVGNAIASASRVPYEVVKQKLQGGEYTSTLEALRLMFQQPNPVRAFFPSNGIRSQMIRDIPYAVFTLLSYEYIRDVWSSSVRSQNIWRDMVCGGVAGGIGSYLTNPMDVIKTRLQTNGHTDKAANTIVQCATQIWNDEGAMAFWKGSIPRLLHKVPANAVFFVCYEFFRNILGVGSADQRS
jgi:solute carrier family 25 S-adenosylmethionine transporter 26